MKVLFIVPYAPTRIRTRSYHLIRTLAADGHAVSLATLWHTEDEKDAVCRLGQELDVVVSERICNVRSWWNCLKALPSRRPLQSAYSWSPSLAHKITRLLAASHYDVVHVEHLRGVRYALLAQAAATNGGTRRPAVVWDSVDCISTLCRHAAKEACTTRSKWLMKCELPRTVAFEGWLATRFHRVLVTSEQDRRDLLDLTAGRSGQAENARGDQVAVVANGVDLEYFSPTLEPRNPRAIVFSGKMSYHANVTGAMRFINEVMPIVWAELPDVRLWIVGKDPPPELRRLGVPGDEGLTHDNGANGRSRVLVTGEVEDIRPYLRRASLAIAPIQYGVGIQNKVLEALACGTPVVATPQAVAALKVKSGEELVVARQPHEMAAAIVALLRDPQFRGVLGDAGRAFVEREHDWRSVAKTLVNVYRSARQ